MWVKCKNEKFPVDSNSGSEKRGWGFMLTGCSCNAWPNSLKKMLREEDMEK